jgi:hypothetical protein
LLRGIGQPFQQIDRAAAKRFVLGVERSTPTRSRIGLRREAQIFGGAIMGLVATRSIGGREDVAMSRRH